MNDSTYANQDVTHFNTAMPWNVYKNVEEYDLKAIYNYLHALAPIQYKVIKFTKKE